MTSPLERGGVAAQPSLADRFHVPSPGVYALTHSVGCLPTRCDAVLDEAVLAPWRSTGGDAWGAWLEQIDGFRRALAGVLGGNPGDYCPQVNLSSGLAKLLPALPADSGRNVLIADEDAFPSLVYVLQGAARHGFTTRLIRGGSAHVWERALTPEVAAVLLTHVHSNTGQLTAVEPVAALCRERGALCIVDVAQSAGIVPLCVPDLGVDAVLGSCVKWLCGGPGAGFLWVDPALLPRLAPSDVGWFSHEDPFEFDVHGFRFAPDARRFWGGTPCVAPYALAAESLRVIGEIGVAALRAHNLRLMAAFCSALPDGARVALDPRRVGGTLCLDPGPRRAAVLEALRHAGVRFDTRGPVLRLSFHIYNSAEEAVSVARCWW